MTKERFVQNFSLLLVHLKELTEALCTNTLSENYRFVLEPSERTASPHLTQDENGYVKTWNKLKNKEISFDEVTALLYKDGKTPKWADCNVYLSTPEKTVVTIHFSRQFRDESEIYYLERGTGPFKAMVNTPSMENEGEKFDVNWKYDRDKSKNGFLRSFLRKNIVQARLM